MKSCHVNSLVDSERAKVSGEIRESGLLTVKEVAAFLRISGSKLYGWIESGKFPVSRININSGITEKPAYRLEWKDIQRFLADRKTESKSMDERVEEFAKGARQ